MQTWRLAWALIQYKGVMTATKFEEAPIYDEGLRQLLWVAQYLDKAHFKVGSKCASPLPLLRCARSCLCP